MWEVSPQGEFNGMYVVHSRRTCPSQARHQRRHAQHRHGNAKSTAASGQKEQIEQTTADPVSIIWIVTVNAPTKLNPMKHTPAIATTQQVMSSHDGTPPASSSPISPGRMLFSFLMGHVKGGHSSPGFTSYVSLPVPSSEQSKYFMLDFTNALTTKVYVACLHS
jgi:hypothetical protein